MGIHVRTVCPHCERGNLRVRPEFIGQRVYCKHCGRSFIARQFDPAGSNRVGVAVLEERSAALAAELREARDALQARTEELDAAARRLGETESRLAQAEELERDLRARLEQSQERLTRTSGVAVELAKSRARIDALESEAASLRGRSDEADRLGEELRSRRDEAEALRAQLEDARGRLDQAGAAASEALARLQASEALASELSAFTAERDALRAEADALRSEVASRDGERAQLHQLAKELDALRAERDRLDDDQRAAMAREAELRVERDRLEQALSEATACHAGALDAARGELEAHRARWESEAEVIHARRGAELEDQAREAERRLDEERRKSAAERAQIEQERQSLEHEATRLADEAQQLRRLLDEARSIAATERQRLEKDRDALRDEAVRLTDEIQRLQREGGARVEDQHAVEAERDAALQRALALQDDIGRLNTQREEADAALLGMRERYVGEIERLTEELDAARREAEHTARSHAQQEARVQQLRAEAERQDQEYERLAGSLRAELDAARRDAAAPREHADSDEKAGLNAQLEEASAALLLLRERHVGEIERLTGELDAARLEVQRSALSWAHQETQLQHLRAEAERKDQEYEQLAGSLRAELDAARRETAVPREHADPAAEAEFRARLAETDDRLRQALLANQRLRALLKVFGVLQHVAD